MDRNNSNIGLNRRHDLEALFKQADANGDGYVCYAELWQFLKSDNHNIPRHIIRKIHERADRNDDGRLECEEFIRMVNDPENKHYFGQYIVTTSRKCMKTYMDFILPPAPPPVEKDDVDHELLGPDRVSQASGVGEIRAFSIENSAIDVPPLRAKSVMIFDAPIMESTDTILYVQEQERSMCWPPTLSMLTMSLVMIIFYSIDAVQGDKNAPMAKIFIYNPHRRREAWRYVSYMFVHVGCFHLIMNLLVQIMLGIPLECRHKWWRVLTVYFCGVLAGGLGTSVTDPHAYLAGASGGVYSLLTAHIASIIMNWKQMHGKYPVIQLAVLLIGIGTDLGNAIHNRYVGNRDQIGYAAHFFGALAGLLIGITLLNLKVSKWEKKIRWLAWTIYLILMTVGVVVNIVAIDRFPSQYV